jgi:hypothetical protein
MAHTALNARHHLGNGLGLIAGGLVGSLQFEKHGVFPGFLRLILKFPHQDFTLFCRVGALAAF